MTLERGALLNKRYRIVEILGQGGMGAIYRAIDENLGMDVAVKENLFTTEEFARQFRREAVILANLRHPNLPRVTDHFVITGQGQYLVMDFIEGEDLRDRMDREGILADNEVVILGAAICDALTYLHTRKPQVLHRDIKPGNVKVLPSGQICLVDFGLAKFVEGNQATSTGARAMTPGYSPPEQYGTARTDERTDIYSLAATLYVALTGVLPEDALARAMDQTDLTPIRKHNPRANRRLASTIEKGLELKSEERYQTAEEFKQALLNSRGISTKRPTSELTIQPPPVAIDALAGSSPGAAVAVMEAVGRGTQGGVGGSLTSSLLSPSRAIPDPLPRALPRGSQKKRPAAARGMFAFLVVALLAAGFYWAAQARPDLLQRLAGLAVGRPPVTGVDPTNASGTENTLAAGSTPTGTATQAATPTSAPTETELATQAPVVAPVTPSATPTVTPTPTGGGMGQIAFASDLTGLPQVWLMNADGTGARQVTDMPEGACQPDWSPDGARLVFISPCAANQETYPGASLFVINADGTGLVGLPTLPGGDFDPDWSPDGNFILFTSLRDYNRAQVYLIDLSNNAVRSVSNNKVRDAQPEWSRDGSLIAFVSTRRGPYQVWTMKPDGSEPTLLSRSGSLKNSNPVWSPDGEIILFTQSPLLGGVPRLVTTRISEGIDNPIIDELIPMREANFSPDGFWIAAESWPDGSNHDIYVMTVNGLGRQRLTGDPGWEFDPVWRPGG